MSKVFKWAGFIAAVCTILGFFFFDIRGCARSKTQESRADSKGGVQINVVGDQNIVGNVAVEPSASSELAGDRGRPGDNIAAEDLKAGVLKYRSASELLQELALLPSAQQEKYAQEQFVGKLIKGWRLSVSSVSAYEGSGSEHSQIFCFDPEFPRYSIDLSLGKEWKHLVTQLMEKDEIVVDGRIGDIGTVTRHLTLHEVSVKDVHNTSEGLNQNGEKR